MMTHDTVFKCSDFLSNEEVEVSQHLDQKEYPRTQKVCFQKAKIRKLIDYCPTIYSVSVS